VVLDADLQVLEVLCGGISGYATLSSSCSRVASPAAALGDDAAVARARGGRPGPARS
jgi:hypothetical protein